MRVSLVLLALLVVSACDSGPIDGSPDLGEFRGSDEAIDGPVVGLAFHDLTRARAEGLTSVPVRLDLRAGDSAVRVVGLSVPFDGQLVAGTYPLSGDVPAEANAWTSNGMAGPGVQYPSVDGTVTVTEVRTVNGYADVVGSVEITFSTGTLTGTFRAVDSSRPQPVSRCTATGCVDY